jgi:predicted metal-dependent peptidase
VNSAANAEALAKTEKRVKGALLGLAYSYYAVFALPAARVAIRPTFMVETAAITPRGVMYMNPKFIATLSGAQLDFVLAHELLHLMLYHWRRRHGRDNRRWGRATDRAINETLVTMGLQCPPVGLRALDASKKDLSAEQHYELEPTEPSDSDPNVQVAPTAGCSVQVAPGGEDGDDDPSGDNGASEVQWRQTSEAVRAAVNSEIGRRGAGWQALNAVASLLRVPSPRVRWSQLLRQQFQRALAVAGNDDVSFSRRSRRSGVNMVLPGNVSYRAAAVVLIDTSGSVSDGAITQAVAETLDIARASGVGVFLVVHDATVQWTGWLSPTVRAEDIAKRMIGRGGTQFRSAYQAVIEAKRSFGALIHLTDGMPCDLPWPAKPRNVRGAMVVALLSPSVRDHVPSRTRIVDVEVLIE